MPAWAHRLAVCLAACLAASLSGCATPIDNAPVNAPAAGPSVLSARPPRDIVGEHIVALSLSGGGLRAAAFGFGVLQALQGDAAGGAADVFDDLTFVSSVSGGSLTAAYVGLHGRAGLGRFRQQVLERDFEADLRLSLWWPGNLARLLAGGVNDRGNLAAVLDRDVFGGATFADLYARRKPDVWINATDLFNRTPFPFIPPVFQGLCSDLARLRLSEAVAASMAVPLAFAPVVLKTYAEQCPAPVPAWVARAGAESASVSVGLLTTTARAVANYRNPQRMRYVKLADGGLTDNQGLASIVVARTVSGTPYGPFTEGDAVRLKRMLFLVVDAGRPPSGDWALRPDGPSGLEVGVAAADAAVDSATRLSLAAFRQVLDEWRQSIVEFRCTLSPERVQSHVAAPEGWRCDDLVFDMDVIGFEHLPPAQAERLRAMPTRLRLEAHEVADAVQAGQAAAQGSKALQRYRRARADAWSAPAGAAGPRPMP